ncbi:MAG TPA: L-histidine N(alpha)-methyltransferase, partial [Stellaceae bacterium]
MRDDGALAAFHDLAPAEESFRSAVLWGLSRRAKSLPCRFLYDERGSALFEQICELPEYYLTRTEMSLLEDYAGEIAHLAGRHAQLIEFGSGSSRKVRILLDALEDPAAYVAIDIARRQLREAAEELAAEFPDIPVVA